MRISTPEKMNCSISGQFASSYREAEKLIILMEQIQAEFYLSEKGYLCLSLKLLKTHIRMQLKGLVRFFTILLILYSVYQLSFTWFVRNHEKKMEASAHQLVKSGYPSAEVKYPGNKELQALYQDTLDGVFSDRLRRLLDSTKDVVVTYGTAGAISYQQAKENELNLGLDLQGGINVTMEVELSGLLRSMSNNLREPNFQNALVNADKRRANSNADYITLFVEEYKKLSSTGKLASIFATANQENIKIGDSDKKVEDAIRAEAKEAFNRTFRILTTRIDQFGVAQPNINPNADRGIITIELPGVQDQERVRKYLQSSANLQFWEVYNIGELSQSIEKADEAYNLMMGGKSAADTVAKETSDTVTAPAANQQETGSEKLSEELAKLSEELAKTAVGKADKLEKQSLTKYIQFIPPFRNDRGTVSYGSAIGMVNVNDSSHVRNYLQSEAIRIHFPSDVLWMYGRPAGKENEQKDLLPLYAIKTYGREKAKLEGEAIVDARQDYDPTTGQVQVEMRMNNQGTRIWADMTRDNVGKPIAIALDNIVYSAPNVLSVIDGGVSSITGGFTELEAQDLSNMLKAGKLPAPAKIVQFQQVGATLGKEAIRAGSIAFVISFIVIFLLMLVYYNTSGWIANIALMLNLLFTIGVLTGLGATLTAPGIAGLVLSIGMAVDSNVVIYERIKEELIKGKSYIQSIKDGYRRSLPPVLDSHITTLLAAITLFYFGLGPVKGFATTLILGLLLSMFCGILVSRWVTDWFTNKDRHLEYFTGVSKRIFKQANFKFIEYRKYAYGISVAVLILGIASIFNGFHEGVEFSGGRSYIVRFDKVMNVEQVRDELKTVFEENPVIKTIGSNNQLDITTSYLIKETGPHIDSLVEAKLFAGLKNHLPPNISYKEFATEYKMGSKTVLPTISDDLKRGAKWATFWSVLLVFLYIFIRFRDWRYSFSAIVAVLHDVLVMLAVFSFFKNIVPFPMEIDQQFIAAILTVIGFSMNDTVIIFDRIREYSREMRGISKTNIINRAINDTLSRTIMTSFTVFLVILILFIFGGEVTRGFAFAMLIGIITGVYSTIFVAAPILVDVARNKPLGKADLLPKEKHKLTPVPVKL